MKASKTKTERQIIKENLKFGDIALIAKLCGKSRITVVRWFNYEGDCMEIPIAIEKLYKKREKTKESFNNVLVSIGK